MRKTLYLLRHAKTEAQSASGRDHDRALTDAGRAAASQVGRWLAGRLPAMAAVRCSTALRARETWELARAEGLPHAVEFIEKLYLASPGDLLAMAQALPDATDSALFVGHNPGLHMLALMLGEEGEKERLRELRLSFPPGVLAVVSWEGGWQDAGAAPGRLEEFLKA